MIRISVCMIVKNEARVLTRCLDSLHGIADELIIVDTGSTDETKEIAARYTELIYDFTWNNDFAAARNFSVSKATCDYVYIADADEVLDEKNRERFLTLKAAILPEIDVVQMYYINQLAYNTTYNYDRELRPKLYKRVRPLQFTDPLHESAILDAVIYDSDIEICHLPQSNHGARDFNIYQNVLQKHGQMSNKLWRMYARELFITGTDADFIAAKDAFEKRMNTEQLTQEQCKQAQCVIGHAARLLGESDLFFSCALKNIATGNTSSEICYELGEYYRTQGNCEEAILWYTNAAQETEAELNILYHTKLPQEALEGLIDRSL